MRLIIDLQITLNTTFLVLRVLAGRSLRHAPDQGRIGGQCQGAQRPTPGSEKRKISVTTERPSERLNAGHHPPLVLLLAHPGLTFCAFIGFPQCRASLLLVSYISFDRPAVRLRPGLSVTRRKPNRNVHYLNHHIKRLPSSQRPAASPYSHLPSLHPLSPSKSAMRPWSGR